MKSRILLIVMLGLLALNGRGQTAYLKEYKQQLNPDTNGVYSKVDSMPYFPGGDTLMNRFVYDNLIYPKMAMEVNMQGVVILSFIVDTIGKIREIKVLRDKELGCTEEAIRLVQLMPDWIPGKQNGRKVPVVMNLWIRYKFDEKNHPTAHPIFCPIKN